MNQQADSPLQKNALRSRVKKARRDIARSRQTSLPATIEAETQAKALSISGPYLERDKWRLVTFEDGKRKAFKFDSREIAEEVKARLLAEHLAKQKKTIGESIEQYEAYRLNVRGVKLQSAKEESKHLRSLLPVDWPLVSLTPSKAEKLYMNYANRPNLRNGKPLSPNTHQVVLLFGKCWAKWCVKAGLMTINPFAQVEPIGKCNAGKLQHTVDEAQRFNLYLLQRATTGDQAAVGVLMMLHLGVRQGEVGARVVRDLDADGRILVIPFGKTDGSRRRVKVPEWLRPILRSLVQGKAPSDLIFTVAGRRTHRQYWWRKVQAYCEQAGVPKVCPHSLRGLHATLAIEEGATSEAVARALGHTSFAMTAKHYATPDSVVNARVARAGHFLTPASVEDSHPEPHQVATHDVLESVLSRLTPEFLLSRLSSDQLNALRAGLLPSA
jgi:site-specific recombinase XerD